MNHSKGKLGEEQVIWPPTLLSAFSKAKSEYSSRCLPGRNFTADPKFSWFLCLMSPFSDNHPGTNAAPNQSHKRPATAHSVSGSNLICLLLWTGHFTDCFPRKSLTLMLKMLSAFTGVIYPPLTTQSQSKTHWEGKSSHLCLPHTSWFFLDLLHPPQGAPTPPSESLSPMSSAALPRHWPLTHPRAPLPGARGYFKTLSLKRYSD